jgi:aryl-alcohol dehydrogenase-like predicted oxidoreductase
MERFLVFGQVERASITFIYDSCFIQSAELQRINWLQSSSLSDVAAELAVTPMQVALAWPLHRLPNILPIPGTSSVTHLRENLAAAELQLSPDVLKRLDSIGPSVAS